MGSHANCASIGNEIGCATAMDLAEISLGCWWSPSEYADPKTEDPSWNSSGFASPDGEEDDGSLYCDCFGNIDDCTGLCGSYDNSLVNTGVYECVGGTYDNETDCKANGKCSGDPGCEALAYVDDCDSEGDDLICNWNYFQWKKIGNDCMDEFGDSTCGGTNYTCFICGDDDAALGSGFSSCADALVNFTCDTPWGSAGTIADVCPVSCGYVCDYDNYGNVLSYPLKEAREKFEKDYLSSQLKKHKGNISKTAEFVGMERSALHRKLKTLGIKGLN